MKERLLEQLAALGKLFSRRWWIMTLCVIAGVFLLVRLGIWQLHRRDEKRALNTMLVQRWQMAPFNINQETLPPDLTTLQFRHVEASGKFDYAHQIVMKNVTRNDAPGVNLITPLVLDDNRAILVARGWIPDDQSAPEKWAQFDEKMNGPVIGLIQDSQIYPAGTRPNVSQQAPLKDRRRVDVEAIQPQLPYKLLPAFILMLPEPGQLSNTLPLRADEPGLFDEFEHTSYAWQWFSFGAVLAFGYLQLIIQQERKAKRLQTQSGEDTPTETNDVDLTAAPHNI